MERRVVDILPPRKPEKKEIEELPEERERPSFEFEKPEWKISLPKIQLKSGLVFILLALIVAGGIAAYYNLSQAQIEIWPEQESLNFKTKITIDKSVKIADFSANLLPGQEISAEKTVSEELSSSGKTVKETKAEGLIRVYNAYSQDPRVLIPSRFISKEGKIFWSLEKITLPGAKFEKGKLVEPGSVDNVRVRADKAGEEYNIGSSTFSLPALVGHPSYTLTYAKSFESMTGGFKKEVSQVTSQDLETAKNVLSEKAKNDCESLLKEKIPSDFDFLETAEKTEILEASSLTKSGAELEKFNFKVKARSTALVFKNEDLKNFAKEFILSQISEGKKISPSDFKINYSLENINFDSGRMVLSLQITVKVYSEIDETALKRAVEGKPLEEARIFLENYPQITKLQLKLWPFWVKNIPDNLEKIKIEQTID